MQLTKTWCAKGTFLTASSQSATWFVTPIIQRTWVCQFPPLRGHEYYNKGVCLKVTRVCFTQWPSSYDVYLTELRTPCENEAEELYDHLFSHRGHAHVLYEWWRHTGKIVTPAFRYWSPLSSLTSLWNLIAVTIITASTQNAKIGLVLTSLDSSWSLLSLRARETNNKSQTGSYGKVAR